MHILAELEPLDPKTDERPTLRACSAQDRRITALNGVRWWPAISQLPSLSMPLFDGDFSTPIEPGGANFTVLLDKLERLNPRARKMLWAGAKVRLYAGEPGDSWPWALLFRGVVDRFGAEANRLKIEANVDLMPFQKDVLTATYAGTTGPEGGADIKNKVKPLIFGRALNVEPVLIDADNSVFQFSAYGPIQGVNALYERASSFGASQGDYATYADLVAAPVPAGRWATCLSQGMVRLGAPPAGVITGDVDGDKGGGIWRRTTGAIIARIAEIAGTDAGLLDGASLAALDAAVPFPINLVLTDQITVLELARTLALPCNAQAGVSWIGKLFVSRVAIGSPALTLHAQGKRRPAVIASTESDVSPPYWRIEMGAKRAWRVHTFDEIAFTASLVPRGDFDPTQIYREGNIVQFNGASYLYTAITATSGNEPPTAPDTANAWWTVMAAAGDTGDAGATLYSWIAYADAADGSVNFTTGAPGIRTYLGIAYNKTSPTEGTDPADYAWSKIKGEPGADGEDGADGTDGTDGAPGRDAIVFYQDTAPTSPVIGDTWINGAGNVFRQWTGTEWQQLLGDVAALSLITDAYIANAAIGTAKIANAAITTLKIGANQVTTRTAASQTGTETGSASTVDVLTINFTLAEAGSVILQATGSQNYSGSAPGFGADIKVDGAGYVSQSGGAGLPQSGFAMSALAVLAAGSHTAVLAWRGDSSNIVLSGANLIVDGAFR